ncbi:MULTISPECIES: hypothetical protein [Methanosarcina]|nr:MULTISPECIES: hypothetical protein [Methanosarcina]
MEKGKVDSGIDRSYSKRELTEEGTKANDTFMTIVQTAKKLGVIAYHHM